MKVGVVFEGGASRTFFTNGVIDVFLREKITADFVVGSSAGIGNGLSYVSGQQGRNLKIGLEYMNDKRYMGRRYLMKKGNRSYYNIDFVFNQITNEYCPLDYEAFANFGGEVYACVTNLRTGRAEYLQLGTQDRQWRAVVASCSLPLLFQPVNLGGELYMDGGVAMPVPFMRAIRAGCDRVIVVLTRERGYRKAGNEILASVAAMKYRRYPRFARLLTHRNRLYNAQRDRLFRLEKQGKVFVIAPDDTHNFKRTETSPDALRKLYDQGARCAERALPTLREYLGK